MSGDRGTDKEAKDKAHDKAQETKGWFFSKKNKAEVGLLHKASHMTFRTRAC